MHLVLGGARSGKTGFAEEQALAHAQLAGVPATYVATAVITDGEMQRRIEQHRRSRSRRYQTVERPRDLEDWLESVDPGCHGVIVLDCLSTYLGTVMYDAESTTDGNPVAGDHVGLHAEGEEREGSETSLRRQGAKLACAIAAYPHPVFVVSNEVGSGIIPAYPSARLFRDVLGAWNAEFARVSEDVTLLVAGLPLALKRAGIVSGIGR
ncbi:MAG: bifunctional adenosylcobinamide kinase/adenosylcobinamide-phosphate guanylyltransferase [Firmicutes bacterium]|nr:bifunctional adenosylcobinamide kinase/adenosylcobinamide-phosphate guanylyltransferase [Bacillota bacterium]